VDAIASRRRVLITYRSEAGHEWQAEVDPWAVVVRRARWYLLCHSHRADAVRTYRVDRVLAAEKTAVGFRMPEDLDPVAVLEENLGAGWAYPTRVLFDAPVEQVAPWIGPVMGWLEPVGPAGEGCVLVGSTRNPAMYAQEWLAAVPYAFHVVGGTEFRDAVATLASRLGAAVSRPASEAGQGCSRDVGGG
jgi:hypothetical protein